MSGFWTWALDAYARPGVADACLALQDAHGQNVPLVLWVIWSGRYAPGADLERGAALAARWEGSLRSLRSARRALKSDIPDMDADARKAFRLQVKAAELEGERALMAALEALPPVTLMSSGEQAGEAERLAEASRAYGAPVDPDVFAALLGRL